MKFRVEEIEGVPRAVFEDEEPPRRELLALLLHPDPYFVPDMLYEISLVERGAMESSGFDSPRAEVRFFRDRVVVEACSVDKHAGEEGIERVEISPDEAKLLLLEWGVALQRRELLRKATGRR